MGKLTLREVTTSQLEGLLQRESRDLAPKLLNHIRGLVHRIFALAIKREAFGAPVVREMPVDPGPHERLLTIREVAARLRICRALVYRLCQRNELPALRIGGALRFMPEVVESFVRRR